MRIERAIALRERYCVTMADTLSALESFHGSSTQLNVELARRVYEPLKALRAPAWVKAYLDGYLKARMDSLYREKLVFGAWIDGRFYSNQRKRADYYESAGLSPQIFAERSAGRAGHYWADKPDSEFFTS